MLALAVFIVFAQTTRHDFVNIDDEDYISSNRHVRDGPSAAEAAWAFTSFRSSNWHPLTWLSLMLDSRLYGVARPGGFHRTNVLLHAASAVVLFLALLQMTRQLWPSALVAGFFAIHPAHVESVAWITERKDTLSGLFGLTAIWAYAWYARKPRVGRYLLVVAALTLGLMAKPMLVAWPFLFLLLDYWPLQRQPSLWLLWEKAPLLLLSAASAVVTFLAQQSGGSVASLAAASISTRFARAAVTYVAYMGKSIWPVNLAIYWSGPNEDYGQGWLAAALVLSLTIAAVWAARKGARWIAVGWLWYLGTLLPTIGIVQVGPQPMADRYLYLPQIGLCIAIVYSAAGLLAATWSSAAGKGGPRLPIAHRSLSTLSRASTSALCGIVLAVLMVVAWRQTSFWRNSATLWAHTLECNSRNPLALAGLGDALAARGETDAAEQRYRMALEIDPDSMEAHFNLGVALASRRQFSTAIEHFRAALAKQPDWAQAHFNLASALAGMGDNDAAVNEYREALRVVPDYVEAHNNLARLFAHQRNIKAAVDHFQKALAIEPGRATIHYNFGNALAAARQLDAAIEQYEEALRIQPDYASARHNLSVLMAQKQAEAKAAVPRTKVHRDDLK
jgi:Tfp pilus assembly protein PilF